MILDVQVKDQEATKNRRSKTLQYIGKDDKDEGKEISSKDKGKGVTSGSGSTHATMNQLLKKDLREKAC